MTIRIKKSMYPEILTEQQKEIMTGLLLGDAYLRRDVKRNANTFMTVGRTLFDKEYNLWISSMFSDLLVPKSISESSYFDKRTNKTYHRSTFRTKSCVALNEYHDEWYSNGTKIIPQDIKLTPLTVAVWFCDDGCVLQKPYNKLGIRFATNGFSKNETEFLVSLLKERYATNFHLSKTDNTEQFIIDGADACAKAVINDISQSFPNGMDRKIKW